MTKDEINYFLSQIKEDYSEQEILSDLNTIYNLDPELTMYDMMVLHRLHWEMRQYQIVSGQMADGMTTRQLAQELRMSHSRCRKSIEILVNKDYVTRHPKTWGFVAVEIENWPK